MNFWDGTSIIVKTASGVKSVKQLGGATICVLPGTTTELDLADWARAESIAYTPVLIGSLSEIRQAFLSGRCDGYTTDSSQVAGFRYMQGAESRGTDHPAGADRPGSERRDGAQGRRQMARYRAVDAFRHAGGGDLGVSSKNVDSFKDTKIPDIRRLLGYGEQPRQVAGAG